MQEHKGLSKGLKKFWEKGQTSRSDVRLSFLVQAGLLFRVFSGLNEDVEPNVRLIKGLT